MTNMPTGTAHNQQDQDCIHRRDQYVVRHERELHGSTLTMVSRNSETLSKWAGIAKRLNETSGAGLIVEHTTDRRAAFDGAGFVVNATPVEHSRLWKLDFEVQGA